MVSPNNFVFGITPGVTRKEKAGGNELTPKNWTVHCLG